MPNVSCDGWRIKKRNRKPYCEHFLFVYLIGYDIRKRNLTNQSGYTDKALGNSCMGKYHLLVDLSRTYLLHFTGDLSRVATSQGRAPPISTQTFSWTPSITYSLIVLYLAFHLPSNPEFHNLNIIFP